MIQRGCLFTLLLFSFTLIKAQTAQLNAAEIKLGLQKLNVVGSVLYIAAHPDDENTRLLSFLAKEKKVRTAYLSLTRGDGGQNLIGKEQAELLGLIRTQELLAARNVDGAEQFFTRANDFGFSKTADEALKIWGKEATLSDVVWVIRKFKPDLIITRFPEDARAGHGQHAASAILAREAFDAAADPKRFSEQLQFVQPWQAKRLLWNKYNFNGSVADSAANDLKINVGLYNPLLGRSYGEIAAESRTKHKSQGFGSANQLGDFIEHFSHTKGLPTRNDLFDGINLNWNSVPGGEQIAAKIAAIEKGFDSSIPSKSITELLQLKTMIARSNQPGKLAEVDNLIIACAGLWFELSSTEPQYAVGERIPVRLQAIARVGKNFKDKIRISEELTNQQLELSPNEFQSINTTLQLKNTQLSQPYWLTEPHMQGAYTVKSQLNIGLPEDRSTFSGIFQITIGNQTISVEKPIVYKYTHPVRGEVYQPLIIAPPVTATLSATAFMFKGTDPKKISVHLQSFRDKASGILQPQVPYGWKVSPENLRFELEKKGDQTKLEFTVTPGGSQKSGNLLIRVNIDQTTYQHGLKSIDYEHIPLQTLFPKAEARVEKLDVKTSGKNIAYIAGAGDLVSESLEQIGYQLSRLSTEEATTIDLSRFDAIILGIRFYNTNPQTRVIQPRLMDYVKNGGTLLIQYNTSLGSQLKDLGPYPFSLSRERVTEEDAAVTILSPNHPILNYPNKITADDFNGWVQERGLYFAAGIDKAYPPILSMHDQNEKPNPGSLLVANYGKGRFVYTSLAFFRQLPAGVPGAYRLFVNLISGDPR